MHADNQRKLDDQREAVLKSVSSLSQLSIQEKAGMAMSPRSQAGRTSFGSSSPRPHLWLGAGAAAGPTTDRYAMPSSPRGSRAGSRVGDDEPVEITDSTVGPGAYDTKGSFKGPEELRKNPSLGASSAFKSGTKRLFSPGGKIVDHELYPGKRTEDVPGVGSYTPSDPLKSSIGAAVAAVKRQAEKLQQVRNRPPRPARTFTESRASNAEGPGPGAYEPGAAAKKREQRQYDLKGAAFRSGSRRALPWAGGGSDAPRSTRARTINELEAAAFEGPGPGDYALPSSFAKAAASPRRNGGTAWTKGAARFSTDTPADKVTPSAVHYTPNYSQCSGR
jgi:hypothetical protein